MIYRCRRVRVLVLLFAVSVVSGLAASPVHATFPGENGKILFTAANDTHGLTDGQIWSVNFDGSGLTRVAGVPGRGNQFGRWSRDGKQIAFLSDRQNHWTVWLADGESGPYSQPGTCRYPTVSVSWTNDDRILLAAGSPDVLLLARIRADGFGAESLLTLDARSMGRGHVASPDATERLAFFSSSDDHGSHGSGRMTDIFTSDYTGNNRVRITSGLEERVNNRWPSWSPDGSQIAYVSRGADSRSTVKVINSDGSGTPRDLTPAGYRAAGSPVWSPDGKQMALSVRDAQGWRLGVINVDGSSFADGSLVHRVPTATPAGTPENAFPSDWQALPAGSTSAAPGSPSVVATVTPSKPTPPIANKTKTTSKIFALAKLSLTKSKFTAGQRKIHFLYTLTHKAAVEVTFKRAGKVVGKKSYQGKAGANRTLFNGAVKQAGKTKRLAPGKYVAFIVAKDSTGKKSSLKKISFQVLKKKA